jgi:hypothetical protein
MMPNMDVRTLATANDDTPYPLFMDYEYGENERMRMGRKMSLTPLIPPNSRVNMRKAPQAACVRVVSLALPFP